MQTAAAQLALECPSETLSEFLSSSSSPPPPQEFQSQLGMLEPGHFIELLNLEKQSAAPAVVDQKPFIPPALVCEYLVFMIVIAHTSLNIQIFSVIHLS